MSRAVVVSRAVGAGSACVGLGTETPMPARAPDDPGRDLGRRTAAGRLDRLVRGASAIDRTFWLGTGPSPAASRNVLTTEAGSSTSTTTYR